MEFECKSNLKPEWHRFVGTVTENRFISDWFNRGWTTLKFEGTHDNTKTFFEIRKAIEPPKCTHENYTCSTTQLFKNGKAMDGQIHSYVCADCGVASSELRTLKLK